VANGNAAEIYRQTGVHTNKASLIRLKDDILARKETFEMLKNHMHGELLFRLRHGKDCTDILATPELADAIAYIASPHREVGRASTFLESIRRAQQQQLPTAVVVAGGPGAVERVLRAVDDPLRLQPEGHEGGYGDEDGGGGGDGDDGGGGGDAEVDEEEEGGAIDYDNGMAYDEENPEAAAVEVVGIKRVRGRPKMPLEEQAEKKRLIAVAKQEKRNSERTRVAQLPTPERNREIDEKRSKDAARKKKSRGENV
jgi:hypothetical protein